MDPQQIVDEIRATLGTPDDKPLADSVRELQDELKRLRPLEAEAKRLQPLADDGKRYREDLIAEALAEGVRAQGENFAAETYRSILVSAPLDAVKRMRDDWRVVGDRRFPGGRQSAEGDGQSPTKTNRAVPDAAYQA